MVRPKAAGTKNTKRTSGMTCQEMGHGAPEAIRGNTRQYKTVAPMGPNARAQVPAVSLASQKPEANRYGRVARAAALVLSI